MAHIQQTKGIWPEPGSLMSHLPYRLAKVLVIAAICTAHQPAAVGKAFTWHVHRNGDLVDAPPASASDPSTAGPAPSNAPVPARTLPGPATDTPQAASTLGLILAILFSGSSYVFGRQLYRRLKGNKAVRQADQGTP